MRRIALLSVTLFLSVLTPALVFNLSYAQNPAAEYLCANGIYYYNLGKYEDALYEFKRALLADPGNEVAKKYTNEIFQKEAAGSQRQNAIQSTLDSFAQKDALPPALKSTTKVAPLKTTSPEPEKQGILSGEYRLALGFTADDVIWKEANADRVGVPREKNWRYLWGKDRYNTYDPKIYDRLALNVQTQFNSPLNAYMELAADPWAVIGKNHVTVTNGTDVAEIDLKYWSADSRTKNETYRSKQGEIIHLKQIKVDNSSSKTTLSGLTIAPTNAAFGEIEPQRIDRDYRPVRKLCFDYQQEDYALKIFPLSDEFEALTSDDPLRLSNNHAYWEESPWLDAYEPSRVFEKTNQPIKRGKWIRSLSYFTKDSSDDYPHRLTFLRGLSFKADTGDYSLQTTLATPMSLWDEYYRSNSIDGAIRLKVPLKETLQVGLTTTSKVGLNAGSQEALNQVQGVDVTYWLPDQKSLYAQVAHSYTDIEEAKGFDTSYDGVAAKVGVNYDASKDKQAGLYKGGLYLAHMDSKFYPGLSNYRYTRRDDPTFSRHIYFSEIKEDDQALIWGDGIDRARNVIGLELRGRTPDGRLDSGLNYRNVHRDSGKYVESVLRSETTAEVSPRLTGKLLGYYKHLPRTTAHFDPLLYNKTMYSLTDYFSDDDSHPRNDSIIDDKDPSIGAFGLGGKYDILKETLSFEGIYERTNDPLDFPRGLLNDLSVTTQTDDGQTWDKVEPFLYDQNFFDLPPYHYYAIAKTKLTFTPVKQWEFILGYTFNENKFATGIDDNINHVGLETRYIPSDKLTLWFKYIYSRLIDVYEVTKQKHDDFLQGHHNIFFGSEYNLSKDATFTFLYGEFVGYNDPYSESNWTLSALDTQHIWRMFYRRKF